MSTNFRWIESELKDLERRIARGLLFAGGEVVDQSIKTITRSRNLATSPGPSGKVYRKPGVVGLSGAKKYLTIITTRKRNEDGTYSSGIFRVKAYRASRSGEAPASRTGNLVQHIVMGPVKKIGVAVFVQEIGVDENAPYGGRLEREMNRKYISRAIADPRVINLAMETFKKGLSL